MMRHNGKSLSTIPIASTDPVRYPLLIPVLIRGKKRQPNENEEKNNEKSLCNQLNYQGIFVFVVFSKKASQSLKVFAL